MAFTISIAHSAISFTAKADETILQAATRQNIALPSSCEAGICSTCQATLLSGKIDYGQQEIYGVEKENPEKIILLCSAYPRSDILLQHPQFVESSLPSARTLKWRIIKREALNRTLHRLVLRPAHGESFDFLAGQYMQVHYSGKNYPLSIANAPGDNFIELHIQDAAHSPMPEPLKKALFEHDTVVAKGPLGQAFLRNNERAKLFIAGGSGFAPMKSMIDALIRHEDCPALYLYWGVRQPAYYYLEEHLRQWQSHAAFHYYPIVSETVNDWQGKTGLVHQQVIQDWPDLSAFDIYLAGPVPMVIQAYQDLLRHQADKKRIFSDTFEFISPENPI